MSTYTSLSSIFKIIKANRESFNNGITLPTKYRIKQLIALKTLINENKESIIIAEQKDMFKRARKEIEIIECQLVVMEIDNLINNISNYIKPESVSEASPMGQGKLIYTPRGNVLIIGPWNFPLNLVLVPLAGAIAAGCTAIIKPSEVAGNVSSLIKQLLPLYLDPNCYNIVTGGVAETTQLLSYQFDLIFFTGGPSVGKIVAKAAAKHLTPCILELGGKNPVVVDDNINLDKVAAKVTQERYGLNCGQVCTAPEYVIVSRKRQNQMIDAFKKALKLKFGVNPSKSELLSRVKNKNHWQRLKKILDDNRKNIVYGGGSNLDDLYIEPSIVGNADLSTPIMKNEVFGPILTIVPVDDINIDAIKIIRCYPKPLFLMIFSEDNKFVNNIVNMTDSGGVGVNIASSHFVVPGFPFGGTGNSGCGRYHGKYTFQAFSHQKPVLYSKI